MYRKPVGIPDHHNQCLRKIQSPKFRRLPVKALRYINPLQSIRRSFCNHPDALCHKTLFLSSLLTLIQKLFNPFHLWIGNTCDHLLLLQKRAAASSRCSKPLRNFLTTAPEYLCMIQLYLFCNYINVLACKDLGYTVLERIQLLLHRQCFLNIIINILAVLISNNTIALAVPSERLQHRLP